MLHLKQSTASQAVLIGPFVDTDGAAVTGLTIDAADIRLSKNGGNIAGKNSGGGTHDELGMYTITLDATDTNTVGRLQLIVAETGALTVYHEYEVLEEAVYDMFYGASALGYIANAPVNVAQFGGSNGTFASGRPDVNTTHWAGTAVGSTTVRADVINWGGVAIATPPAVNATQISGDSAAADALELAFDATAGAVPSFGIIDRGTAQSATGTTLVLRAAAGFADDEIIGATIVITGGSAGVGQSRQITDYVSSSDTATVATWTTTPTGTITYEIYGTPAGSGSGATAQEVWEYATRELTALDEDNTTIDLNAAIAAAAPTAAAIADAVWDEDATGHQTQGTFGQAIGDPAADTKTIYAAVVTDATGASVGVDVAATLADTNELQTDWTNGGRLDLLLDATLADTNELQTDWANGGRLDLLIDGVKAKTDALTFTVTNVVDANITHVIADPVQESGATDTNWGGAP